MSSKSKDSSAKDTDTVAFDETLRRMLNTPPKPHDPPKVKQKQSKKQKPTR